MRFLIERWLPAAMAAGILGLAAPALAQTSGTGVDPIFISGDASLAQIKAACGIAQERASLNRNPIVSPATTPDGFFSVTFVVSGDFLDFEDISDPPDQFRGTRGVEAVAVRRNSTNVYCYPTRVVDTHLDAPGSGAPNEVTVVWGPGPCQLEQSQVDAACSAYNPGNDANGPDATADFLQAHVVGTEQPLNICGCFPNQATLCDPALPAGQPGSCNPESGLLMGIESTVSGTAGSGTCEQVTTSVGGRLRTTTVCN